MGFSLGTLTAYTEQNKVPLVMRTLYGSQTGALMTKQSGIKSSAAINYLATTAQFQADACSWNDSGTTTVTQRNITVGSIAVMESLCLKDLEQYYMQTMLNAGTADGQSIPFEQMYSELKADTIAQQLEIAYWQGDTTSWNANLKRFDGFIKLIDAAGTAVNGNTGSVTTGTGITSSNVVAIINAIYAAIPAQVLRASDTVMMCGTDVWRLYQAALVAANLYSYNGQATGSFEIVIPGTNLKLVALDGLTGTSRIFAGRTSNFYIGTDLLNEEENFDIWYSKDNVETRFRASFKAGVQVAIPSEITTFKLV